MATMLVILRSSLQSCSPKTSLNITFQLCFISTHGGMKEYFDILRNIIIYFLHSIS